MPRATNLPTEFLQRTMNWIIADVHRPVEVLRETLRHSHSLESERGVKSSAKKIRMDPCKAVVRDVERMFRFECRRLFPHGVTCNSVINFGDENPIRPASKGGAHPLVINLCPRPRRQFGICVISAKMSRKGLFVEGEDFTQVLRLRRTNAQSVQPFRKADAPKRRA